MNLNVLPSSVSVLSASPLFPPAGAAAFDMDCASCLAVPPEITPENAHEFPELVREIEEIERDCHQAKNPWSRGVASLFILAHSGRFHDYVTQNGLLSDTGREFLETLEGSQREIDPAVVQRNDSAEKGNGGAAPQKEMPAAAPLQAASENISVSESELRDMENVLTSLPSGISPGIATLISIPVDPAQIPAAISFLSHKNDSLRMRAVHYLTAATMMHYDISEAFPHLGKMLGETLPFGATVTAPFRMPVTKAIKTAREHEASSAKAYDLLIDMLGSRDETVQKDAEEILFIDLFRNAYPWQRSRSLAALRCAERHPNPVVRQRVSDLLSQHEKRHQANAECTIIAALKPDGAWGPIDRVSGPERLAECLQAEPELMPAAIKLLDSSDDRVVEAVCSAFGIVAEAGGDVTPAIKRMFDLCFSPRLNRGTETSDVQRAFGALIRGAKTRNAALDLLEPKLAKDCVFWDRSAAYNILRTSARGQRAMDMLARGLGDEAHGIRNDVREALKFFACDPKTSREALHATAVMLFEPSPENRKLAAEVFEVASDREPMVASDRLVAALATSQIAVTLSGALYKAALRIDSRASVLTALLQGLAHKDVSVRTNVISIVVKLFRNERTMENTALWLARAADHQDANVRAGVAVAYGRAAKEHRPMSKTERDMLARLAADKHPDVRTQAAWALKNAEASDGSDLKADATPPVTSPAADVKGPEAKPSSEKPQATPPPVETPQLDEPGLKRLLAQEDYSIWRKARPGVVKALLALDADKRLELLKQGVENYDSTSSLHAVELYRDLASQITLSSQEIQFLLETRSTGRAPTIWDYLESALNAARTARHKIDGQTRFLSRDAYFEIMGRAIQGEFGDHVEWIAHGLLRAAAENSISGDVRAARMLGIKTPEEREAEMARRRREEADARVREEVAERERARAEGTRKLLDPESLAQAFRSAAPQGLSQWMSPSNDLQLQSTINSLIVAANASRLLDPVQKGAVSAAVRKAVAILEPDESAIQTVMRQYYIKASFRNLLTIDDVRLLRDLALRHPGLKKEIDLLISDARSHYDQACLIGTVDRERAAASTVKETDAPQPVDVPQAAPRIEPPSPQRQAFIDKMVERILKGDGKAAAEWAKLVGEGKAETHALPILLEVLAAVNDRSKAVPRLANAIANPTNNPKKKMQILTNALLSKDPRISAGAAMVFGELGRFSLMITFVELARLQARLAEDADELVRKSAEDALIAIGKNPEYRAAVVGEVSATAETVTGKKLESLNKVLKEIG